MPSHDTNPVPIATQRRFQDAMRIFAAECFWWCDTTRPITTQVQAREIIRQLRLHGGKPGWRAAADLVRCL